jgi:lysozyme
MSPQRRFTSMVPWLGGLAALLAAAMAAWLAAGAWHPSDAAFPRQGIDVSHHQGRIDWRELPAQGVDFAYLKATEGGDHKDSRFAENWSGARDAGIKRGAYHFFTLCRSGAAQAANFIDSVPLDVEALPPAVDLEYLGNCASRVSPDAFHAELATFIERVEAHYQKPVLLYLTAEFDSSFGVSHRIDRPLWLRNLVFEPRFGDRPWQVWQVSNFRRLAGIDGRVDWNVSR